MILRCIVSGGIECVYDVHNGLFAIQNGSDPWNFMILLCGQFCLYPNKFSYISRYTWCALWRLFAKECFFKTFQPNVEIAVSDCLQIHQFYIFQTRTLGHILYFRKHRILSTYVSVFAGYSAQRGRISKPCRKKQTNCFRYLTSWLDVWVLKVMKM